MLQKTSGIVLHSTKYSESSLIVKIYTLEQGAQSYIIGGVRSKRSKNKASLFQPLALVDIVVSGAEKTALKRITEITVSTPYQQLPYHIIKSSLAIFINEILLHSFKEPHPDENLFLFIRNSLLILDLNAGKNSNFHLGFMLQLSRFLGFFPQGTYTGDTSVFDLREGCFTNYIPQHPQYLSPSYGKILSSLLASGYDQLEAVTMSKAERKHLLNALVLFFQLHIPSFGEIKSTGILEEIIG